MMGLIGDKGDFKRSIFLENYGINSVKDLLRLYFYIKY